MMDDGVERVVTIHHNGDFSGDAIVVLATLPDVPGLNIDGRVEWRIPGTVLKSICRQAVIYEAIEAIENLM
jgi:hypothetical protein